MSTYFAELGEKKKKHHKQHHHHRQMMGLGLTASDYNQLMQQTYGGSQAPPVYNAPVEGGIVAITGGPGASGIILPGSKSDEDYAVPEGGKKVILPGNKVAPCPMMYAGDRILRKCQDDCNRWWISHWSEGTFASNWVTDSKPDNWGEMPCPGKPGPAGSPGAAGPSGSDIPGLIQLNQTLNYPIGGQNCEFVGTRHGKQIFTCDDPRHPGRRKNFVGGKPVPSPKHQMHGLGVQLTVGPGTPESFENIRPPSDVLIPRPNVTPAPATSPWVLAGIAVLGYMALKLR